MTALLVVLTVLEVVVFVGVLAAYLLKVQRILRTISQTLAKLAMGVRAIERQTRPLGSGLLGVNDRLTRLGVALGELERAAARR